MFSLGTTDTGTVTLGPGEGHKVNKEFTAHDGSASTEINVERHTAVTALTRRRVGCALTAAVCGESA
jgi:hypothetical protein